MRQGPTTIVPLTQIEQNDIVNDHFGEPSSEMFVAFTCLYVLLGPTGLFFLLMLFLLYVSTHVCFRQKNCGRSNVKLFCATFKIPTGLTSLQPAYFQAPGWSKIRFRIIVERKPTIFQGDNTIKCRLIQFHCNFIFFRTNYKGLNLLK